MPFKMENPAGQGGASEVVHADRLSNSEDNQHATGAQVLRADLIGSTTCTCGGITTTGSAPVLAMCRELLGAGVDPDTALEVYRGPVLALRVRSIGEGARLTVKTAGNGAPIFVEEGPAEGAGAPPVRKSEPTLVGSWRDRLATSDSPAPAR